MSLLLEALKKAERAKEEAQRRARPDAEPSELRLEPVELPAAEAKPVVTRAELPDIKQPLEILSDDIDPKEPQPAAPPDKPSSAPRAVPPTAASGGEAARPTAQAQTARATGRKVFEAKFREPNPRLPFYITLGLLGAFALGTASYFWYQLRPRPPLVTTNAKPAPAAETAVSEAPAGAALPGLAATTALPQGAAIPGLPAAASPAPTPAAASVPAPAVPRTAAAVAPVQASAPASRTEAPAPAKPPAAATAKVTPPPAPKAAPAPRAAAAAPAEQAVAPAPASRTPQIHPRVEAGYRAYLAGDFAVARAAYSDALRDDATNRDALLGMAAVDMRSGRLEAAEATYLKLLQLDPNDAYAQAGLISLRSARLDPLTTESRVKSLLATDPGANVLHFTLGNQLAQQGRWPEAQQEYFKAFAANPESADIAYNLAVSLDHMRQTRLALDYYRRAIALAEGRGASFDVGAARTRAAQLAN